MALLPPKEPSMMLPINTFFFVKEQYRQEAECRQNDISISTMLVKMLTYNQTGYWSVAVDHNQECDTF